MSTESEQPIKETTSININGMSPDDISEINIKKKSTNRFNGALIIGNNSIHNVIKFIASISRKSNTMKAIDYILAKRDLPRNIDDRVKNIFRYEKDLPKNEEICFKKGISSLIKEDIIRKVKINVWMIHPDFITRFSIDELNKLAIEYNKLTSPKLAKPAREYSRTLPKTSPRITITEGKDNDS